jgi:transcriptional regulator with AAA-type ATPase domain
MRNLTVPEKLPEVYGEIDRAVQSSLNVLLDGESGVGKDYFARLIHRRRNRGGELVVYDCESTIRDQTWIVDQLTSPVFLQQLRRSAQKDTFFIRRIDILQAHLLARLSDFFEELGKRGAFPRNKLLSSGVIGSLEKRKTDLTSNKILLYKFLNSLFCFKIKIPPLRERKEEIPCLVERFISDLNDEFKKKVRGITSNALKALLQYHWPNNLCELRAEIERAMTLTRDSELIKTSALSDNLMKSVLQTGSLQKWPNLTDCF